MLKWHFNSCFIHSLLQCIVSSKPMLDAILDECTLSLAQTCPMLYHMRAATHDNHYHHQVLDFLDEGTVSVEELEIDGVYVVDIDLK